MKRCRICDVDMTGMLSNICGSCQNKKKVTDLDELLLAINNAIRYIGIAQMTAADYSENLLEVTIGEAWSKMHKASRELARIIVAQEEE